MRNIKLTVAITTSLMAVTAAAKADVLDDIFLNGKVDGELRAYNFDRLYDTHATPDARAFSGAALLNLKSGTFAGGFGVGLSLAAANSAGAHNDEPAKIDSTLAGIHNSVTAVTQAFVQYQKDWFLFRGGYQYLTNPWMGNNDSRVIPSSYNALMVDITPTKGWDIYGIREFQWKSRTSDDYFGDNLYYPSTYHHDTLYGNNGSLPATADSSDGTWAVGSTYVKGGLKAQAWYYNFKQFARMGYADGSYVFKTGTSFDPVVGAQYVTETGGSNNLLVDTNTKLFGVAGTRVKSETVGADLGVIIPHGRFDVYYNKVSQTNGAVGDGALISPYTTNYATDPLYTTSMIRGLVEQGPGHAWKAKATYNLFDDKLQLAVAYTEYTTELRGDSHDIYGDIIYNLDGYLKGLSLRDRWERSVGGKNNLNPGNEPFTYNRVMIAYKF
jgi:hypothetical protein